MRVNHLPTIILCLACCISYVSAAGTASGTFLKLGIGAKNIAMGGTGVTDTGASAVYWNPAGLAGITGNELSLMHAAWLDDVSFQNITYARSVRSSGIGVSVTYLSMPSIDKFDNTGVKQNDTFKPSDMAASFSYALGVWGMPVGASIKYISSTIDDVTASAVAGDVGLLIDPVASGKAGKLRAGVVVQNIGTAMKFEKESFTLPLNVKAGLSYAPVQQWEIAADADKYVDENDVVADAGTSYLVRFSDRVFCALRGGYKSNVKGLGGLSGWTMGLGFGYRHITIDYAFVPYGDFDDTHRVSLTFDF